MSSAIRDDDDEDELNENGTKSKKMKMDMISNEETMLADDVADHIKSISSSNKQRKANGDSSSSSSYHPKSTPTTQTQLDEGTSRILAAQKQNDGTFFKEICIRSKIDLDGQDDTSLFPPKPFNCESIQFSSLILRRLLGNDPLSQDAFASSMEKFFDSDRMFHRALLPLNLKGNDVENNDGNVNENGTSDSSRNENVKRTFVSNMNSKNKSLIRLIIEEPSVQTKCINFLFDKFIIILTSGDSAFANVDKMNSANPPSLPLEHDPARLILTQLRWLDFIVDGKGLAEKLIEVISAVIPDPAGPSLSRELIACLPEILTDSEHGLAAEKLQEMMTQDRDLMVPIVESLSNLTLPASMQSDLVKSVLNTLQASSFEDLPILIRFLMLNSSSIDKVSNENLLKELRIRLSASISSVTTLDAEKSRSAHRSSSSSSSDANNFDDDDAIDQNSSSNYEPFIIRELVNGILTKQALAAAYFDMIKNDPNPDIVDLWLLIALRKSNLYQKKASSLLKYLVGKTARISTDLLDRSISKHKACMESYFSSLMDVANSFLRISSSKEISTPLMNSRLQSFGSHLYQRLYSTFSEVSYRQEIIYSLVVHCSAGITSQIEVDTALRCLRAMTRTDEQVVLIKPFAEFINSLLNRLESFDYSQTRILFRVICRIAASKSKSSGFDKGDSSDWLRIFLRKKLNCPDSLSRMIGIIGTVQLLAALAPPSSPSRYLDSQEADEYDMDTGDHSNGSTRNERKDALQLFALVFRQCKSSTLSLTFLFDEVARAIEHSALPNEIVEEVSKRVSAAFEDSFICDLQKPNSSNDNDDAIANQEMNDIEFPNDTEEVGRLLKRFPKETFKSGTEYFFGSSIASTYWLNLDYEYDGSIAIQILRLLEKGVNDASAKETLIYLCPQLRCLLATEKNMSSINTINENGNPSSSSSSTSNLDGQTQFDGLLGCPLLLPSPSMLSSFTSRPVEVRETICNSLFHSINWIRETINVFCNSFDKSIRKKVCMRMDQLLVLEAILFVLVSGFSEFEPPIPINSFDVSRPTALSVNVSGSTKKSLKNLHSVKESKAKDETAKKTKSLSSSEKSTTKKKKKKSKVKTENGNENDDDNDEEENEKESSHSSENDVDGNGSEEDISSTKKSRKSEGKKGVKSEISAQLRGSDKIWKTITAYFRDLSPNVCKILGYSTLILHFEKHEECENEIQESPQKDGISAMCIGLPALYRLLDNLNEDMRSGSSSLVAGLRNTKTIILGRVEDIPSNEFFEIVVDTVVPNMKELLNSIVQALIKFDTTISDEKPCSDRDAILSLACTEKICNGIAIILRYLRNVSCTHDRNSTASIDSLLLLLRCLRNFKRAEDDDDDDNEAGEEEHETEQSDDDNPKRKSGLPSSSSSSSSKREYKKNKKSKENHLDRDDPLTNSSVIAGLVVKACKYAFTYFAYVGEDFAKVSSMLIQQSILSLLQEIKSVCEVFETMSVNVSVKEASISKKFFLSDEIDDSQNHQQHDDSFSSDGSNNNPILKSYGSSALKTALSLHSLTLLEKNWESLPSFTVSSHDFIDFSICGNGVDISKKFLSSFIPRGMFNKKSIGFFLEIHLSLSDNTLECLDNIIIELEDVAHNSDESSRFPCLTKETIHLLYGPCIKSLSELIQSPNGAEDQNQKEGKKSKPQSKARKLIEFYGNITTMMWKLMDLTRVITKPTILREAVKYGKVFVDMFLKKVMPKLNKEFDNYPDEVTTTLAALQKATRQLQTICAHGKDNRDVAMLASIPSLRRSLESLIYSVKQMVVEHKGTASFEVGNLKAKNLDGSLFKKSN